MPRARIPSAQPDIDQSELHSNLFAGNDSSFPSLANHKYANMTQLERMTDEEEHELMGELEKLQATLSMDMEGMNASSLTQYLQMVTDPMTAQKLLRHFVASKGGSKINDRARSRLDFQKKTYGESVDPTSESIVDTYRRMRGRNNVTQINEDIDNLIEERAKNVISFWRKYNNGR
jgi:hypothetical protein